MNTNKPTSDIDIAFIGENIAYNDILKIQRSLFELPYGYTYDILYYNKINLPEL